MQGAHRAESCDRHRQAGQMTGGDPHERGKRSGHHGRRDHARWPKAQHPTGHKRARRPRDRTGDLSVLPKEAPRKQHGEQHEQRAHRRGLKARGSPKEALIHASIVGQNRGGPD